MKLKSHFLVVLLSLSACLSQPIRKKPTITYAAGPNQLTILFDENAFRFAYETDNQFRAERRYPNGTVAGYYGYIGADGKPVRVQYGVVDDLGFTAISEIIPDSFPETEPPPAIESITEIEEPTTTESEGAAISSSASGSDFNKVNLLPQPHEHIIDEENDSISVDAIQYYESEYRRKLPTGSESTDKWSFPLIDVPDLPKRRKGRQTLQQFASSEEPFMIRKMLRGGLVMEQQPGEPAIIYVDPDQSDDRFVKTARVKFTLI